MKYCVKCGSEMEDEALFCSKCGNMSNAEPLVKENKSRTLVICISVICVILIIVVILLVCILSKRSGDEANTSTEITTEITENITVESSEIVEDIQQTTEGITELTTEIVTVEATTTEEVTSDIPKGYTLYTNERFGYTIAIPEGFEIIEESENGDGVTFGDTNGYAQIQVWGAYNVLGSTGRSEVELASSNYPLYDSKFDNSYCWYSYTDEGIYNFVASYFTEELEVGFSFRYITDFYEERYDLLCTEMADYVITGKSVQ